MDWGSVADWVSGIGSVAAVSSAIWIASKESRSKLSITVFRDDYKYYKTNGQSPYKDYNIVIHNPRLKAVHVRKISFVYRKRFKYIQLVGELSGEKPIIDTILSGELKYYTRQIDGNQMNGMANKKQIFIIAEDIEGKKYKTKFTP